MKHLLNNLSQSEKNRILEQYNNSLLVDTSKFKKLLESKLGNVKPLLTEGKDTTSCLGKLKDSTNYPGKKYYKEIIDQQLKKTEFVYYTTGSYYESHILNNGNKYVYPRDNGKYFRFYCEGSVIKKTKEIVTIDGKSNETKITSVPFKDNTEGNKFRAWVNQNYPKIAREIDLDKIGTLYNSFNNEYITKAWNYVVDGKTLGDMYSKSLVSSKLARIGAFGGGLDDDKSKIQTDTKPLKYICPIITKTTKLERFYLGNKSQSQLNDLNVILNDYAISYTNQGIPTRISCQAALNKLRPGFRDKNQIIIDSREHLIYVYDKNNKFIAKDAVITGANAQSKIAEVIARSFMDFNDKLEASGFKQTTKGIIDTTGKNRIYNFNYILSKNQEMGSRFLNPGIYTTDKYTTDDAHYAGKKDNILSLSHLKHGDVLQAIHGFVTTDPNRVAAINLAKSVISDPTNPSVGKKFLDMVNLKQINLSQSYGCINLPERFVPYLERYMKDSYVFNISEDQNNYLVQNTENYFEKMKEPFCPSPSSLGAEIPAEFDQLSNMS